MEVLFVLVIGLLVWLVVKLFRKRSESTRLAKDLELQKQRLSESADEIVLLKREVASLDRYREIPDIEAYASKLRSEAEAILSQAKVQGLADRQKAQALLADTQAKTLQDLASAGQEAEKIIANAKSRAVEIAGEAYDAMNRAKEYQEVATAMKNLIDGYGDSYLQPAYSLLDELADEFGFTDAGQRLKTSRESTRAMMLAGRAATCDYVEAVRKSTAIQFVLDAFNGKVDSVLSRSKADNHGKLEREIRDAYAIVNRHGAAFRNARITEDFLIARLDELKWAATAHALKDQEREEQRALREQMREEEKARKEYERAIRDAAKEEETLRKAMEKAQAQVAAANDAQRAELESRLLELQAKLKEAEERNQRALSMAQQTRTGHVYVISNLGSFGEHVFKIGMTRRLEPKDRVRELGDASVPFEFDIHAMIFSDDAPTLEKSLHRHFLKQQVNKVNPRKEFFRVDLQSIRTELEQLGIETHWTMKADAEEYRATLQLEKQIAGSAIAEEEWTKQQLQSGVELEDEVDY